MPTPELKPCPWGGPAYTQNWLDRAFRVVCKCGVCKIDCPFNELIGEWKRTREEAAETWNRRADTKGENDGNA